MQDKILRTEVQGALNLSAKSDDALLPHLVVLAADVDQVAGVDDEWTDVVFGAQLLHAGGFLWFNLGRAPHAGARREYLEGVCANLFRAQNSVGCAAGGA